MIKSVWKYRGQSRQYYFSSIAALRPHRFFANINFAVSIILKHKINIITGWVIFLLLRFCYSVLSVIHIILSMEECMLLKMMIIFACVFSLLFLEVFMVNKHIQKTAGRNKNNIISYSNFK